MCVWASYLVNILESTNFFKSSPRPQKFPLVRLRNAPTPGLPHGHRSKDGQGPRRDALLDTGAHGRVVSQSTSLQSAVMTSTNIKLYSTSQATIIWYRSRITTNNNTYDHRTLKISSLVPPVKTRGAGLRSINCCSFPVTLFSRRDSVVAPPLPQPQTTINSHSSSYNQFSGYAHCTRSALF